MGNSRRHRSCHFWYSVPQILVEPTCSNQVALYPLRLHICRRCRWRRNVNRLVCRRRPLKYTRLQPLEHRRRRHGNGRCRAFNPRTAQIRKSGTKCCDRCDCRNTKRIVVQKLKTNREGRAIAYARPSLFVNYAPSRDDRKAIRLPSGDQTASSSTAVCDVSARRFETAPPL